MIIDSNFIKKNLLNDLDIIILDEVDSTNTHAKNTDYARNTLIITTNQLAGRGRFNRRFYSHKESGVFFTLVLKDNQYHTHLNTLIMGLAVSDNLNNSKIKWLNDVMINNKKVAGILSEATISNGQYKKMIIGIGINLKLKEIPKELEDIVYSYDQQESSIDHNQLIVNIINDFFKYLTLDTQKLINLYKKRCLTLNEIVTINNEQYFAYDISNEGALLVRDNENKTYTFNSGEVSINAHKYKKY